MVTGGAGFIGSSFARKLLDVTRLQSLGWQPTVTMDNVIRTAYAEYLSDEDGSTQ